jgi:Mn-dependent DtxR family transcriptional regulator
MEEVSDFRTVRGYQLLERNKDHLTSAMEDYLEMIYRHSLVEGYMRINILSELLNVAAPSATRMVQNLSKLGLLDYKKYGIIFMTETGRELGSYLLKRHEIISVFLQNLGVREKIIVETELIEHTVSASTLHKMIQYNHFLEQNPDVRERYASFCRDDSETDE